MSGSGKLLQGVLKLKSLFKGMLDDPPRYMGEGFVLMSSNDLEMYFYMDEAGLVPEEPVLIRLANGEMGMFIWNVCNKKDEHYITIILFLFTHDVSILWMVIGKCIF